MKKNTFCPLTFSLSPVVDIIDVKQHNIAGKRELTPQKLDENGFPEPFWRRGSTGSCPLCGEAFPGQSFRH